MQELSPTASDALSICDVIDIGDLNLVWTVPRSSPGLFLARFNRQPWQKYGTYP